MTDWIAALFQNHELTRMGHGQRRKYVAAGTARHDEHRAAGGREPAAHRPVPGMRITAAREFNLNS